MGCRRLAPGFRDGAAKNAGRDRDDLEYDPVGLGERVGGGRLLAGMKMAEGGGCGGGRGECGVWRGRERAGGSYHRPVFGGGKRFC